MDFLYQCDDNYAPFTGISIYSLFENNKYLDRIRVFVINDHISEENLDRIKHCADSFQRELVFIDADALMQEPDIGNMQTYKGTRKNTHSFLKMLAIDRLPDDVEHILYLDSDTLVLDSLGSFASLDIGHCFIAMALDSLVDEKKALIGFERSDPYYNSGVIYIDIRRWKDGNCRQRLIDHSAKHSYGTVDQDILNVEFKGEIYTLPAQYNFQPHHLAYREIDYFAVFTHKGGKYYTAEEIAYARDHICIMHFFRYLGEQPWHKGNLHPCTGYFDRYMKMSLWSDFTKKESGKGIIFKIEKALYVILPKRMFLKLFMFFFTVKLKKDIKAQNEG